MCLTGAVRIADTACVHDTPSHRAPRCARAGYVWRAQTAPDVRRACLTQRFVQERAGQQGCAHPALGQGSAELRATCVRSLAPHTFPPARSKARRSYKCSHFRCCDQRGLRHRTRGLLSSPLKHTPRTVATSGGSSALRLACRQHSVVMASCAGRTTSRDWAFGRGSLRDSPNQWLEGFRAAAVDRCRIRESPLGARATRDLCLRLRSPLAACR